MYREFTLGPVRVTVQELDRELHLVLRRSDPGAEDLPLVPPPGYCKLTIGGEVVFEGESCSFGATHGGVILDAGFSVTESKPISQAEFEDYTRILVS